ncbi:MAG: lytic murein transglycosylase, partial [Pseudorhodobacter sp.]|nr:lytic murein transglycosylase [Pseudorhodobacter sp.]
MRLMAVAIWLLATTAGFAAPVQGPHHLAPQTQGDETLTKVAGTEQGLTAWIAGFRGRALAHGIAASTFDQAFSDVRYNPEVIDKDRHQAEFTKTIWDYLDIAASDERVSNGQKALRQYRKLLARIEATYGVEKEIVVAVWGLESSYGARRGKYSLIEALATLAYDGRRGRFFEQQLLAALQILQHGDVRPQDMTGSWAGAMGHTQFIPTSYLQFAVDFTG